VEIGRAPANVVISAQEGPQSAFVACPVYEVFYGGARGGAKTFSVLLDWIEHSSTWKADAKGLLIRRTYKQLESLIAEWMPYLTKLGATWRGKDSTFTMSNGATVRFGYLDDDRDAENYMGQSLTRLYIEEAGNFPFFAPIQKLFATLRSGAGVPVGVRLTGNPGGPGHAWLKQRYIDPHPTGWKVLKETIAVAGYGSRTMERVFIPSKVSDNPLLMTAQPNYVASLAMVGSKELVRAWLEGDWNAAVGAYFTQFNPARHVLPADFQNRLPSYLTRFQSIDWGYSSPFCVSWFALSDGRQGLPDASLIQYREWYGTNGLPNEGMRLPATEVARKIKEYEVGEKINYRVGDPSMWQLKGGPSFAEEFMMQGVPLQRGTNNRLSGWDQVRKRLVGEGSIPTLYILDNCPQTIQQLEIVPADEKNREDVDTKSEDHAVDALRYAVMSRPHVSEEGVPLPTMDEIVAKDIWTLDGLYKDANKSKLLDGYN